MNYFIDNEYLIRRKIFTIFGGAFHIYDRKQRIVAYTKMKGFKLKEDLRLYTNEIMTEEVFRIKARNILDFSAVYDVFDFKTNAKIGALKRKGFKSMFKDEWVILDTADREIGLIKEDSMFMALLRRFINIIPQSYNCVVNNKEVCEFKQNFNPFVMKIRVLFKDCDDVHRSLVMAGGILLCAIEGKQK